MGATGENVRRLTDVGFNPAWSPDGSEVACAQENADPLTRNIVPSKLWAVNVTSGEKRLISIYFDRADLFKADIWMLTLNEEQ